uniref:Uncharacterized protein n=1 Tax=Anguilla anguilla TaxID=7936 RepID=A0A0E9V8C5_ANGAN
MLLCFEFT